MSNQQVTLFQFENGAGPARSLVAAGMDNALGEGIRSSYAILSIKAGRWRIKYKGNEIPITRMNAETGQMEPVPSLEVVLVKANPFLNKQYYAGKYAEGSNSKPDCYSLDGKVPSASVEKPQFSNCTMCPKNQFGSLIGENGTKQKACRDTKKLAIVPLQDLRNESFGGPMLFRVPPSSLKDLSALADAMKARGYPYNSVAVRLGFDMDASHPKPTFKAIRPLSDAEAEVVLELFQGDGVAAVLADNDVVVDAAAQAAHDPGKFENEPVVGVGAQAPQAPVAPPPAAPQARTAPVATQQAPVAAPVAPPPPPAAAPVAEAPITMVATAVAPPPPGMHGSVVQPFQPGGAPPPNPFAQPAAQPIAQAPVAPAAPKPKKAKPVVDVAAPTVVEPTPEPETGQLGDDINNILKGLSAFTGAK
jgi:hypothetical protein